MTRLPILTSRGPINAVRATAMPMIGKSAALITPRSRPVFRTMKENSPSCAMLRPIPSTNGLACQKPKEPDTAVHRAQLAKKMVASVITATDTQYVAISERSISAPMVTKNIAA
jgi:hypothetical protein